MTVPAPAAANRNGKAGLSHLPACAGAPGTTTAITSSASAPARTSPAVAARGEIRDQPPRSTKRAVPSATTAPAATATIPQAGAGASPSITAAWGSTAIAVAARAGMARRAWRAGSAATSRTTLPAVNAPTSGWTRVAAVSAAARSQSGPARARSPRFAGLPGAANRAKASAARGRATTLSRASGSRTKLNDRQKARSAQKPASRPNRADASRRAATAERIASEPTDADMASAAERPVRVESVPMSAAYPRKRRDGP